MSPLTPPVPIALIGIHTEIGEAVAKALRPDWDSTGTLPHLPSPLPPSHPNEPALTEPSRALHADLRGGTSRPAVPAARRDASGGADQRRGLGRLRAAGAGRADGARVHAAAGGGAARAVQGRGGVVGVVGRGRRREPAAVGRGPQQHGAAAWHREGRGGGSQGGFGGVEEGGRGGRRRGGEGEEEEERGGTCSLLRGLDGWVDGWTYVGSRAVRSIQYNPVLRQLAV